MFSSQSVDTVPLVRPVDADGHDVQPIYLLYQNCRLGLVWGLHIVCRWFFRIVSLKIKTINLADSCIFIQPDNCSVQTEGTAAWSKDIVQARSSHAGEGSCVKNSAWFGRENIFK